MYIKMFRLTRTNIRELEHHVIFPPHLLLPKMKIKTERLFYKSNTRIIMVNDSLWSSTTFLCWLGIFYGLNTRSVFLFCLSILKYCQFWKLPARCNNDNTWGVPYRWVNEVLIFVVNLLIRKRLRQVVSNWS